MSLHTMGPDREGYPAGVSSDRKPAPKTTEPTERTDATGTADAAGPRPRRLTYAAALAGLEGLVLVAGGIWMLVAGVTGHEGDRKTGITGGVTVLVLALLPLLAARGLLLRRGWSRGPAVITQIMALPVAYTLLRSDGAAIPGGIVLAAVAVTALVLLVNPETTSALGIKGPGRAGETGQR
ncbi:hypothetical protein ACF09J_10750 [Streptomyces sp. NPDC014889]|uniref:hypothetical protein n=1 Tax=Streptomyces sp. NPDC014889 TaxID=3364928 RepID=UPI00370256D2